VGGAHLKVALADNGTIVAVEQYVCPLWQGFEKLSYALQSASSLLNRGNKFAVTMTGELSDLFPDRKTGVETLVQHLAKVLGPQIAFWAGQHGFANVETALAHHRDVGSTNFLATATLLASRLPHALLVDFGSTTTDIIPIRNGKPAPRGLTDAERLTTGELVYTGLTRTSVASVTNRAPFKGQWVALAREYFATMADVRRILGELPDGVDLHATADGKGKTYQESVSRFARLVGRDGADGTADEWRIASAFVREQQLQSIYDGVLQVLSANPLPLQAPVVTAGIGADTASVIALRLGRNPFTFGSLLNVSPALRLAATHSAPAVAVALLAN
jgi:probable H4MPT-linked C1 transfer pathway protein